MELMRRRKTKKIHILRTPPHLPPTHFKYKSITSMLIHRASFDHPMRRLHLASPCRSIHTQQPFPLGWMDVVQLFSLDGYAFLMKS
jgi:hypothetical protein